MFGSKWFWYSMFGYVTLLWLSVISLFGYNSLDGKITFIEAIKGNRPFRIGWPEAYYNFHPRHAEIHYDALYSAIPIALLTLFAAPYGFRVVFRSSRFGILDVLLIMTAALFYIYLPIVDGSHGTRLINDNYAFVRAAEFARFWMSIVMAVAATGIMYFFLVDSFVWLGGGKTEPSNRDRDGVTPDPSHNT